MIFNEPVGTNMENDTFMNLNDIHLSRDSWPSYSKYDLKFTSSHRNFHKRNFTVKCSYISSFPEFLKNMVEHSLQ